MEETTFEQLDEKLVLSQYKDLVSIDYVPPSTSDFPVLSNIFDPEEYLFYCEQLEAILESHNLYYINESNQPRNVPIVEVW